jgi:hypothetical protein
MRYGRFHRALVMVMCGLAFLAEPAIAAGEEASPGAADLPEAAAPFGLVAATVPADGEQVWVMFAGLPQTVDGLEMQPLADSEDRVRASWGEEDPLLGPPLMLQALSFRDGDFFPTDFTAGEYVAMASAGEDFGASGFGRDGGRSRWGQARHAGGIGNPLHVDLGDRRWGVGIFGGGIHAGRAGGGGDSLCGNSQGHDFILIRGTGRH